MRLTDRVTIIDKAGTLVAKDVPAHVGGASSKTLTDEYMPVATLTTLRMIVGPNVNLNSGTHDVLWQGHRFTIDRPLPRMRRGRIHHYTVALSHLSAV